MTQRPTTPMVALAMSLVASLAVLAQTPQAPTQQTPPVFRSGTTLIPVDVRVIDKNGKPVTDLTQADFTVTENGVVQSIRHFSKQALAADTSPAGLAPARASDAPSADLAPQNRRVFLIVLGRGRLQSVAGGVDGMIHLVRDCLLPQDQVAVLAWNRATEFTTDHAGVVDLLQRFKKAHEGIEGKLDLRFSGLAAIYGGNQIPAPIQRDIDAVFGGPRAPSVRTVAPGVSPNAGRMADDVRRDVDLLQNPSSSSIDQAMIDAMGVTLDEYVSTNARTRQDLGKLYLGVEYLRHLDGEKHLVFVSESGLRLPRGEDDTDLAAAATDARVAIEYVHTGGTPTIGLPTAATRSAAAPRPNALNSLQPSMTARTLADRTGGSSYWNRLRNATEVMDRVDAATRFEYLLGYYPARELDGKYRQIRVQVNRPGLTVLYRHGYYAVAEVAPLNRERILTFSRVSSAAGFNEEIHDVGLRVSTVVGTAAKNQPVDVTVTTTVDVSRMLFARDGIARKASIELVVFVLDGHDKQLGMSWRTVEFTFREERYQQALKDGVAIPLTVPATGGTPRAVKVVVYNYAADVAGSVVVRLK